MNWSFWLVLLSGWINRDQTAAIEYLQEENRILRQQLKGKRLTLTDIQRQRLAARAYELGKQQLKELETIITPATLMRWYRQLVAKKFDGSQQRQQGPGRPRVDADIEALVLCIAQEKPSYGYLRIQGVLANLGHDINASTVRNILWRNTIESAPNRNNGMRWNEIAGVTANPDEAFMLQCARQLTDPMDGFLSGKRYLIRDRDTKFTAQVDRVLRDAGVKPLRLPARSPNLNAHAERFVRSIKEEALDHLILFNKRSLRYALKSYLAHYHQERNHQGLENQLIEPIATLPNLDRPVVRHDRLGGLLSYYDREAA